MSAHISHSQKGSSQHQHLPIFQPAACTDGLGGALNSNGLLVENSSSRIRSLCRCPGGPPLLHTMPVLTPWPHGGETLTSSFIAFFHFISWCLRKSLPQTKRSLGAGFAVFVESLTNRSSFAIVVVCVARYV